MQASTRAYLDFLRSTPYRPAEWMRDYQRQLMEKILRHAREHVPFYADRLGAVFPGDGRFDTDRWEELPIFTRAAAQQAGAALFAREAPAEAGNWIEQQTSGSTGMPFRHRRSQLAGFVNMCVRQRDYERYGLDFDRTVASIQSLSGKTDSGAASGTERWNFYGKGQILRFDVRRSIEQQFEWLRQVRAPYLRVFPSVLRGLAEHALAQGASDLSFDAMMPFGENLLPETRAIAQQAFGGRVIHSYGATETGRIGGECPDCGRFHVPSETILVEILRDDGTAAAPGEIGRVVVTPFYNFAMPLIRYEIGDLAEVGRDGACENQLPAMSRTFGRTRNLFKLPNGSRVLPDTRAGEMLRYIGLVQVQVVQTTLEDVEVRYVADTSGRVPDESGLQDYFRSVIHASLKVKAVQVPEISRTASGKFEDYVSLVN